MQRTLLLNRLLIFRKVKLTNSFSKELVLLFYDGKYRSNLGNYPNMVTLFYLKTSIFICLRE